MKKTILFCIIFSFCLNACTIYARNFSSEYYLTEAERAEALEEKGEYLKAIEAYEKHIVDRQESGKLFVNENPYFYKLLIGDLYLKLIQPDNAEQAYVFALEKEVSKPLTTHRLKKLGTWYEEKGDFENAFLIVEKHRELDPLLFDLEIDRLHKAKVEFDRQISLEQPIAP